MNNEQLLKQFEKHHEAMSSEWDLQHREYRKDIKFTWFNKQWAKEAVEDRKGVDGPGGTPPRPCNVFNIMKPFIIKVCNGIKKLRMSPMPVGVDGDKDKELAEVRRGLFRAIERNTEAVPARDTATNQSVTAGYGFYAIETQYEDPRSQNQEIRYRVIHDASDVYWDDDDMTVDGSGLKKLEFREAMSKDEFKIRFNMDWDEIYSGGNTHKAWGSRDKPVVSEYWYIEEKEETLVTLKNQDGGPGENIFLSELEKQIKDSGLDVEPEHYMVIGDDGEYVTRKTHSRKVWCCWMAGKKVVKKELWPGYWIPWFKVEGRLNICEGDVIRAGLTRDGKASQECYNYARNGAIERLGMSTKKTTWVPEGGIPNGEEQKYGTRNTRNWPYVYYNAFDEQGRPLPPPTDSSPPDIDMGHVNEANTSENELRNVFGLYGAYTGNTQNEKSGRAILAGAQESADIVFDFADNKVKTMAHEAKVINELIPKIYDTPRQVKMVGEDDAEKVITVNARARDEKGKEYYYDMKVGKFDFKIEMSQSDETKRLESREGMEMYMKALPNFAPMMADLYAKEQDWRYSDEIAKRAKNWIKSTSPGIIEEKDGPPPEVVQLQAQMQQMQQQAMAAINQLQQENQQLKSKQAVDMAKIQTQAQLEAAKLTEQKTVNEERNEVDIFNAETQRLKAEVEQRDKLGQGRLNAVKTMADISKQKEGTPGPMTREQPHGE